MTEDTTTPAPSEPVAGPVQRPVRPAVAGARNTMHEMNTCAVRGMLATGRMCGKVIVGGKFCGHDGDCEHKRTEMCEATDEILPVYRATKDGGNYTVKCPHCRRLIGLEGDDLSQIRGEQFQHKRCGGWLEVTHSARVVPVL